MNDEMTSVVRDELFPPTRNREFHFSEVFRINSYPEKHYEINEPFISFFYSRFKVGITGSFIYPAVFEYGSEATTVIEVSRNDVVSLLEIIENHILSDTENAYKLRRMRLWESFKLNRFGKIDKELPLSSNLLWVRRTDGFWLLINAQFMGRAYGDTYSEKEWRKLFSVLTKSLLESSQSKA